MKTQHVLITGNGTQRTSNVTYERIFNALYNIGASEYVTLEKCQPVKIIREAEAFAMTFYKDSRIAVYFRVQKTVLRMCKCGIDCEKAIGMMCDFFHSAKLPDMTTWTCEEFRPEPQKTSTSLMVDGEEFRYFDFADVMAALENIRDGLSRWLNYTISGDNNGYMTIHRYEKSESTTAYKVEWVRWNDSEPTGCRGIISDFAALRGWLWELALSHKYPDPGPQWTNFDVNDYFQKLAFRFLDEDDER